jgi:hypothetical protein
VLPPDACAARFRELQVQLQQQWAEQEFSVQSDCDILVVPSLSLDERELTKIEGVLHYEERLLFSLIRLRNPRTRVVYVTSQPLLPIVIDYYLQLLPGIPFSHARDRLLLLSTCDASLKPLTQKILERPRLLQRIRQALRPGRSLMTCYNVTDWERQLSVALDIPLLGANPDLAWWGTKAGSRELFEHCQVPHPPGTTLCWSSADLAAATAALWQQHPEIQRVVIKINEGFSGEGNALLDLTPLGDVAPGRAGTASLCAALERQFQYLQFQAQGETWETFSSRIHQLGAIAEVFVEGEIKRSPSAQVYIQPSGEVEVLSTHEQILGGPDGQVYLGCYFPADAAYRLELQTWGIRLGECLASKGAMERFSVDFVASQQRDGHWDLQAIEINLRKGGTTHPLMSLRYLTNGQYDPSSGLFLTAEGQPKYYVATDNLQHPQYKGLLPLDLMDIVATHQLHFDSTTRTGSVFHLLGCLSEFGKVGLTSIGNSPTEAQQIYDRVVAVLDQEACCPPRVLLRANWFS